MNDERRIRQRAFYYTHVFADHQDEDVVYLQNTSVFRSDDGGATYEVINNGTHGDFHDFWIDPDDPTLVHADLGDRLAALGARLTPPRAALLVASADRLRDELRFNLNRTLIAESLLAGVAGGPIP